MYSEDLAEYDFRTMPPGWVLAFAMPSMIVDRVLYTPNVPAGESALGVDNHRTIAGTTRDGPSSSRDRSQCVAEQRAEGWRAECPAQR
ncbi:hypothetical protein Rhow_005678 [Rhodococcus wratislaviensis]|uniref:Uncharacterized protein n=1 Tax=Rhodococcus wratislaviensis TaxID=44752 RepID=A0A402CEN7_RHOWR|nr:hypothetical protein Rhow_005678 [Rhodococcus wratislaviensis]